MKLIVEGSVPLIGNVKVSGSKNSALQVIIGALFSNEDVIIDNVPKVEAIIDSIELIKGLGGSIEWLSENKIVINASSLYSFEVPYDIGSEYRTSALLAGPLLYRFGKAHIPKFKEVNMGFKPMSRLLLTWSDLGFEVEEDDKYYYIKAKRPVNIELSFKINTVMGTENAILSSIFIPGETIINGAASEPEVDNLIKFLNGIGANVKRVEERKVIVNGATSFGGAKYKIMPDRIEVATFAVAALLTNGDVKINDAISSDLIAFIRKLETMGANFEFKGDSLRVWKSKDQKLKAIDIETAAHPGFMTDWQPLLTVLLTQTSGTSLVHDTIYTNSFSYTKELNRMGAKISLLRPSEVGLKAVISDDRYDLEKLGEPYTVAKIEGPTLLRRDRLNIPDLRIGAALVLAALAAEGKSELYGIEYVDRGYEHFEDKLSSLGAKISKVE